MKRFTAKAAGAGMIQKVPILERYACVESYGKRMGGSVAVYIPQYLHSILIVLHWETPEQRMWGANSFESEKSINTITVVAASCTLC